jgi:hypothetical protein
MLSHREGTTEDIAWVRSSEHRGRDEWDEGFDVLRIDRVLYRVKHPSIAAKSIEGEQTGD